jgi:hypothetical protein
MAAKLSKSAEPLPIRQSDNGKWEVKDPYYGNWIKRDTKEDAEILSNEPVVTVLFKYCSMATQEKMEHTMDILKNQQLFYSAPDSFNDPFECQMNISFNAPMDVKNKKATEMLKKNPNMTDSEAKRLAPERWKQIEQGGTDRLRSLLYNNAGVVCFSTIKDDILMWAHYAGGHNGICIEFSLDEKYMAFEDHVNFFKQARRVNYEKEMPRVNFYTTGDIKILNAAILTKSEHWVYEKEFRIIETDIRYRPHYITVPSGAITAMYLGCKITDRNRDTILQCIKETPQNNIKVFQAKCKPDVYGLYFDPISI